MQSQLVYVYNVLIHRVGKVSVHIRATVRYYAIDCESKSRTSTSVVLHHQLVHESFFVKMKEIGLTPRIRYPIWSAAPPTVS